RLLAIRSARFGLVWRPAVANSISTQSSTAFWRSSEMPSVHPEEIYTPARGGKNATLLPPTPRLLHPCKPGDEDGWVVIVPCGRETPHPKCRPRKCYSGRAPCSFVAPPPIHACCGR